MGVPSKTVQQIDNYFFTHIQRAEHFIIHCFIERQKAIWFEQKNISNAPWWRSKGGTSCPARIPRPAESSNL